jgi:PAS domain S-box-containing protein
MTVGGTGIFLIRGLSQNVDYARVDNANHLSLTFTQRPDFESDGGASGTVGRPDSRELPSHGEAPVPPLNDTESLAQVLEIMPLGAAVIAPDLTIHYVNRKFRELMRLAVSRTCPFDGRQLLADRSNADLLVQAWHRESAFECELRRDDGEPLWVLTSARSIQFTGIQSSLVWFQDITANHRATLALKRREERLALAVVGAGLAVWEVDLITGQHWWSPAFYRMLGYPEAEATALTDSSVWERHLHPEHRDQLLANLAAYLKAPTGPYDAVYRMVRVDGSALWVEVKGHPTVDETGRATRLNGVSFDVTARINTERDLRQAQKELIQAEKMAALGSLVAGVAHEINTPIGNTLTAASHLYDREMAFRKRLETETIRKSDLTGFFDLFETTTRLILRDIERAVELIQSFKQVAVDQTSGERRQFDLKGYIEEVFLSLRPRIRKTRLEAQIECPRDILMDSYPGPLSQVLTNFVINSLLHAFDAGEAGHLRVQVSQPRPDMVELVYSDDGKGMPPDVLAHIFDPFFTTKRGAGGSGLGMHIVYNIITATLRGTIRVESEVGRGARFILRLPVNTPAQASRSSTDG